MSLQTMEPDINTPEAYGWIPRRLGPEEYPHPTLHTPDNTVLNFHYYLNLN